MTLNEYFARRLGLSMEEFASVKHDGINILLDRYGDVRQLYLKLKMTSLNEIEQRLHASVHGFVTVLAWGITVDCLGNVLMIR